MRTVLTGAFTGYLLIVGYGQERIDWPQPLLAGPWEVSGSSGIDGFFLPIDIHVEGSVEPIATNVRVHHREGGKETWGRYPAFLSGPAPGSDGPHLLIFSVRGDPTVNVTFDAETRRWIGTWDRDGQVRNVVLERPRSRPDVTPHPLSGEWEGLQDGVGSRTAPTRLHVDQSLDGVLTAWMDRLVAPPDRRQGQLLLITPLRVISAEPGTVTLETPGGVGLPFRYEGSLSSDGSTLGGTWSGRGSPDASRLFRRIR